MNYKEEAEKLAADPNVIDQIRRLLVAIHELKRTRSEDQARARVEGFKDGEASVIRQLRGQQIEVEVV